MLVTKGTPFLAFTATLTRTVHEEVMQSLEMVDSEFVCTSTDRPNIFCEVHPCVNSDTDMAFCSISEGSQGSKAPPVVVYCHSLDMCTNLYAHFLYELGDELYYPSGAVWYHS